MASAQAEKAARRRERREERVGDGGRRMGHKDDRSRANKG